MGTEKQSPGDRLRKAREAIGYPSAAAAAKAMEVPIATYTGHEANHRGFPAKKAVLYAKHFHVSVNWLLFGEEAATEKSSHVPVIAIIENRRSQIRELTGNAPRTVEAPLQEGIKYAFQIMHDGQHVFAGWTFFLSEKSGKFSEVVEDKLCLVGLSDSRIVLAKPRRSAANGLIHLVFFGEEPQMDVKINWISRVIAARM